MPGSVQRTDHSSHATRLGALYGPERIAGYYEYTILSSSAKVKVNFALQQATKAQRGRRL